MPLLRIFYHHRKHKVGLQVACTAASCCKVDTRDGGPAVSYHCGKEQTTPKPKPLNQQPFKLRHGIAMQLVATLQCHDGHRTIRNVLETNTYLAQVSNWAKRRSNWSFSVCSCWPLLRTWLQTVAGTSMHLNTKRQWADTGHVSLPRRFHELSGVAPNFAKLCSSRLHPSSSRLRRLAASHAELMFLKEPFARAL